MTGRAGLASALGQAGQPGMNGAPAQGAGQGQQQKEYKRPPYRESTKHLDEALGEAPAVVKQVVE